jgi:hypothetical protein
VIPVGIVHENDNIVMRTMFIAICDLKSGQFIKPSWISGIIAAGRFI